VTLSVILMLLAAAQTPSSGARPLDAHFVNDRVLVDAPLASGGHIRFWTDTGGGGTILYDRTARLLGLTLAPLPPAMARDFPPGAQRVDGPLPLKSTALPPPAGPIFVAADGLTFMGAASDADGNLGQNWFAGRVWTWDYPRGTLALEPPGWKPPTDARVIPVGFRPPAPGASARYFPRIEVTVAGEAISVLLDTGATTVLTPEAAKAIDGGPRLRATSMIAASRLAAWRRDHPTWRVIEQAQGGTHARMIEAVDVAVAGIAVGPVWFTERPDGNFTQMMSAETDRPVEGALGGNAFHSLRMTLDYPHGLAAFAKP